MTTYLEDWGLTAEDDNFHAANDDPWWTETFWLAWFVPERKITGYIYPMFRPNLGIQAGGVMVYDDTGDLEWEMRVYDYDWTREIPPTLAVRDVVLSRGLTIRCTEPARLFEIGYQSRDLQLRLTAEGVMRP